MIKALKYNTLIWSAVIFLSFVLIVFFLSSVFGYQTFGGYLPPLVLFLLTWWLYKREGNNLSELGFNVSRKNIYFFPLGLLIGVLFLTLALCVQMLNEEITFRLNPAANYMGVAIGFIFLLQGVLNEELIFRGYCLQKTIQRIGFWRANLCFSFLFMVWHWISWNAWGNYEMMLGSITTGFGHLLFATALLRTGTLYFPIGIHLGINWASLYLFSLRSNGQRNDVFFIVSSNEQSPTATHNFINLLLTLFCYIIVIGILWKKGKQKKPNTVNSLML